MKRGKSWYVPWGLARAWGVAHLVRGGRVSGYAPFLELWTRKGGDTPLELLLGESFFVPNFSYYVTILLQSEQKRGVLYSLYIYI